MTMVQEAVLFSNVLVANSPFLFKLTLGGKYSVSVVATFGGGSIKLQKLGPDASTYVDHLAPFNNAGTEVDLVISTFAANGTKVFDLAPGDYQFLLTTATSAYLSVARIPD